MASDGSRSVPHTPLRHPTAYFQRHDRRSLGVAAGIMLAEGLALGVVLWLFVQQLLANVDSSGVDTGEIQARLFGAVIMFVVLMFVGWLLLAAILHAFVWFADGNRGFGTTLAIVGETEFVAALTIPLTAIAMLSMASGAPADPQAAAAYVRQAAANSTPVLSVIGLVGMVWRAVVSGAGIATIHGIPREKAFAATFIVGILGFLLGLAT